MNKHHGIWVILVLFAWGCAGSSTGNPGGGKDEGTDIIVPKGAELVKSDAPRETDPKVSDTDIKALGQGNREFAFDLYTELAKDNKNLFFSPYSISVALAMTYAGAEGDTESEMRDTLHLSLPEPGLHTAFNASDKALQSRGNDIPKDSEGDGFTMNIVNQAWGQKEYKFLDGYLDVLAVNYGAGLLMVDFTKGEPTRKLINDWVADQTKDRIKDLLPENSVSGATLVLTNAIYFKASWMTKFDPSKTQDGVFHGASGDKTVPLMHQNDEFAYVKGTNYQAVTLPYLSNDIRMLVILPDQGQFEAVSGGLNETFYQQVLSTIGTYTVTLTMPKFSFESENRLGAPLQTLGMTSAFSDEKADFSGISGQRDLYIDEVYHKAFVAVDEKGTEAAAATAVVMKTVSMKPSAEIVIDRPFIFVIYDEPTGQILFLGHVKDIAS